MTLPLRRGRWHFPHQVQERAQHTPHRGRLTWGDSAETVVESLICHHARPRAASVRSNKQVAWQDVHQLLVTLGLASPASQIRLIGHDISSIVAYAYAAAHPDWASHLTVMEAPQP